MTRRHARRWRHVRPGAAGSAVTSGSKTPCGFLADFLSPHRCHGVIPPAKGKQYCPPCPTEETLTHHASGKPATEALAQPSEAAHGAHISGDKTRVPDAQRQGRGWSTGGEAGGSCRARGVPVRMGRQGADRGGGCARLWQSRLVRSTRAAVWLRVPHLSEAARRVQRCSGDSSPALERLTVGRPGGSMGSRDMQGPRGWWAEPGLQGEGTSCGLGGREQGGGCP